MEYMKEDEFEYQKEFGKWRNLNEEKRNRCY